MGFSVAEGEEMIRRTEKNRAHGPAPTSLFCKATEESEKKLHHDIMDWCQKQWPRWQFIRARMDKPSGIAVGCHDMTIFGPYPVCLCVECKNKNGKLSENQRNWAFQLKMLGWTVFEVRSLGEFLEIAERYRNVRAPIVKEA